MFNDFETYINNPHVCKVSISLKMEVEGESRLEMEDAYIENVNDGHVNVDIVFFSSKSILEHIPLNIELITR